jgi:hypothetical protein
MLGQGPVQNTQQIMAMVLLRSIFQGKRFDIYDCYKDGCNTNFVQENDVLVKGITQFNQTAFNDQTLRVIAALRLSFRSLENIELRKWIRMASYARTPPLLMTTGDIQSQLASQVANGQHSILALLPPTAKISIAIDCWTSPNHLAFMAITGYVRIL